MRCTGPGGLPPSKPHWCALLRAALGDANGISLDSTAKGKINQTGIGADQGVGVAVPSTLKASLRPYQLRGFQWLVNNVQHGFGCILADDMGLGKTMQAIAMLLHLKQEGALKQPALIVVPRGLMATWVREIGQWTCELKVSTYCGHGRSLEASTPVKEAAPASARTKRAKVVKSSEAIEPSGAAQDGEEAPATPPKLPAPCSVSSASPGTSDVVLTSYGILRNDSEYLCRKGSFSCIVLDEAQQIKNYSSQTSKAVKKVADAIGNKRVALSGTPVENRLAELHSLFEFTLPGYLAPSRADFDRSFARPITAAAIAAAAAAKSGRKLAPKLRAVLEQERSRGRGFIKEAKQGGSVEDHERQELLQRLIRPFVLRRLKSDPGVAPDLPGKIEYDHTCDLSEAQASLYAAVQEHELARIRGSAGDGFARRSRVLAMVHALREVCNHPASLKPQRRPPGFESSRDPQACVEASGKCVQMRGLLEQIFEASEKVVVFCQYRDTVDMLAEQISAHFGCSPLKYTGSMTPEQRDLQVKTFQEDAAHPVILLTLQAGCVGLTLTAASHVIHFDRCYNPAKESQATDRVHRIGQGRTVCVHRLISQGTFEERLAETMVTKRFLSDLAVQAGEGCIADLGDNALRELVCLASGREGDARSSPPRGRKRRKLADA